MRVSILFVALLAAVMVYAADFKTKTTPVNVQNVVEYRYIGFTQFTTNGVIQYQDLLGIAAMNKICADEFGPSARAAFTSEALFRTDGGFSPSAWVRPTPPVTVKLDFAGNYRAVDALGYVVGFEEGDAFNALRNQSCRNYVAGTGGPLVSGGGDISLTDCSVANLRVACSAPRIIDANFE